MIVYVESNFILEIALEQEQSSSAEAIFKLAESKKVELAFPHFALSEPFATVMHRGRDRSDLHQSLTRTLRQLQRSERHKQTILALQPLLLILKDAVNEEFGQLHSTVARLLKIGTSIELDESMLEQARSYREQFGLKPQDSIIYAAVIADLQQRPPTEIKCFVSRNWRDFDDPGIKSELASYNCRYIGSFTQSLNFIQRAL